MTYRDRWGKDRQRIIKGHPLREAKPWMATPRHETRRLVVDAVSFILAVILVLAAVSVDYAP